MITKGGENKIISLSIYYLSSIERNQFFVGSKSSDRYNQKVLCNYAFTTQKYRVNNCGAISD